MDFIFRNDYRGENGGTGDYHIYNQRLDYWISDSLVCTELSRLAKFDAAQQRTRLLARIGQWLSAIANR